jgi:hypothetical protein
MVQSALRRAPRANGLGAVLTSRHWLDRRAKLLALIDTVPSQQKAFRLANLAARCLSRAISIGPFYLGKVADTQQELAAQLELHAARDEPIEFYERFGITRH